MCLMLFGINLFHFYLDIQLFKLKFSDAFIEEGMQLIGTSK